MVLASWLVGTARNYRASFQRVAEVLRGLRPGEILDLEGFSWDLGRVEEESDVGLEDSSDDT